MKKTFKQWLEMTDSGGVAMFMRPAMPMQRRDGQQLITEKKPQKKKKKKK